RSPTRQYPVAIPMSESFFLFWALRENSWKSTPIEGVAGNLVIQQERPPNETVAKSPSIRLFSAFVCPPRFSDLRPPPTSGRGPVWPPTAPRRPIARESMEEGECIPCIVSPGLQSTGSRSHRSPSSL